MKKDFLSEILGIAKSASQDEIKKLYRKVCALIPTVIREIRHLKKI
jgi:preprotein translocase subunit Sec63